jgi:hypothetical protein
MSTDFSIRPVGAPVAPAFPPAASNAALVGVPTQLPANQSVTATDPSTASSNNSQSPSYSQSSSQLLSQQAFFDTAAASVVFQSVDDLTGEVVQQYPDDATLRRRAYFHSLDQAKDSFDHPLATDVTA